MSQNVQNVMGAPPQDVVVARNLQTENNVVQQQPQQQNTANKMTYDDLASLTVSDLNKMCKDNSIALTVGRKAKRKDDKISDLLMSLNSTGTTMTYDDLASLCVKELNKMCKEYDVPLTSNRKAKRKDDKIVGILTTLGSKVTMMTPEGLASLNVKDLNKMCRDYDVSLTENRKAKRKTDKINDILAARTQTKRRSIGGAKRAPRPRKRKVMAEAVANQANQPPNNVNQVPVNPNVQHNVNHSQSIQNMQQMQQMQMNHQMNNMQQMGQMGQMNHMNNMGHMNHMNNMMTHHPK